MNFKRLQEDMFEVETMLDFPSPFLWHDYIVTYLDSSCVEGGGGRDG